MQPQVVVLDYDGTIATDGVICPDVRGAIADVRVSGRAVILATGRILKELHQCVGDLRIFDAIVAENGAVLAFPESGRTNVVSPAPRALVEALQQHQIPVTVGECVVETDASAAPAVLDLIRQLELPLVLAFNRGRLMILPQGVSKGLGLREALRALRLSEHNAIAIGDAENDHAMLDACEIGIAVGWGSPALKRIADRVLDGDGPPAVAAYLRSLLASEPHVDVVRPRRALLLGITSDQHRLSLAVRGRNVLIAGDPRSGKSWLAGLLSEQLILQHYSVCIIDPEGDYAALDALPGVIAMGGVGVPPRPHEVMRILRHPDTSLVIDLSHLHQADKHEYVTSLLPLLEAMRARSGVPHRIVLDEAHYFAVGSDGRLLLDPRAGGHTLISYRPALLPAAVLEGADVVLVTRLADAVQCRAIGATQLADQVEQLTIGEAMLLANGDEAPARAVRFKIAPRLTSHVRHRRKYLDVPVSERQAFVFTQAGHPTGSRARTLTEFCAELEACSAGVLDGHLDRSDISRWLSGVFGDHILAARVHELERLHQLDQPLTAADALCELIEQRYLQLDGDGS